MEQDNKLIKNENVSHIEALLEKPYIKEESDVPDYVDINSFSERNLMPQDLKGAFPCTQCPSRFRKLEYLNIHTAVHGDDMVCPLCCESFFCRKQLREHINYHIKHKINEYRKVIYNCTYCFKNFNSKKQHTIHLRVHTNERPYKCEICGEGFKQLGALKDHRVTHSKERKYVCEICKGAYTTSSSLKRHKKKIHDRSRTIVCTLCTAQFYNKANFTTHRLLVHRYTGFKKNCPLCSTPFYNRLAYSIHKQLHDDHLPRNKQLYMRHVCSLCGEETNNLKYFIDHRRWHISYTDEELKEATNLKSFQCKFCPIVYRNRTCLFNHMDLHKDIAIRCDLCHKFTTYLGLRAHKRRVHQLLNCRICYEGIIGRPNMYHHYKKCHTFKVTKNYECNICGKKCELKTILKYHYKHKHKINAVKNFKCGLCGKHFVTQYRMTRHKDKMHSVKVKFKCSRCDFIPKTTKDIKLHKLLHVSRELSIEKTVVKMPKQYRCNVCKKFFLRAKNYQMHISLNTCVKFFVEQGRLHVCEFCKKTFSKAYYLRRHLEAHCPSKKVYSCQDCGEAFDVQSDYEVHCNSHVLKTEEKSVIKEYLCEQCGEAFALQADCEGHSCLPIVKTEEEIARNNYLCEYCGEALAVQSDYEVHCSLHLMKIEEENVIEFVSCGDLKSDVKMES